MRIGNTLVPLGSQFVKTYLKLSEFFIRTGRSQRGKFHSLFLPISIHFLVPWLEYLGIPGGKLMIRQRLPTKSLVATQIVQVTFAGSWICP